MIILIVLLLIVFIIGILFLIAIKGFVHLPAMWKTGILIFFAIGILFATITTLAKGFFPIPVGYRHLIHLAIPPKDLYEPIITDKFLFYEEGFSKTYLLKPKYLNIYEIGFLSEKKDIPASYKFRGKLKVEFFHKDKFLFEKVISSWITAAWLREGDIKHIKEVSLLTFDMPLLGKYKNDVSVKITVIEPDKQLEVFGDSIRLHISVSATP